MLRLIAVDRAIHVIVLSVLAIVLFTFARHDATLHRDYQNIMSDLSGTTRVRPRCEESSATWARRSSTRRAG